MSDDGSRDDPVAAVVERLDRIETQLEAVLGELEGKGAQIEATFEFIADVSAKFSFDEAAFGLRAGSRVAPTPEVSYLKKRGIGTAIWVGHDANGRWNAGVRWEGEDELEPVPFSHLTQITGEV